MENLQLKTCLSPMVHFLIVETGRSRKKMEGEVSCLTSDGFINWEQARCCLSGRPSWENVYSIYNMKAQYDSLVYVYVYSYFGFKSDN